jgi:hypothetical protein
MINHVLFSVRHVEVRTPLSREADAVEKVCKFPEMGVEILDTIAC